VILAGQTGIGLRLRGVTIASGQVDRSPFEAHVSE
jgi:hypothetical protein